MNRLFLSTCLRSLRSYAALYPSRMASYLRASRFAANAFSLAVALDLCWVLMSYCSFFSASSCFFALAAASCLFCFRSCWMASAFALAAFLLACVAASSSACFLVRSPSALSLACLAASSFFFANAYLCAFSAALFLRRTFFLCLAASRLRSISSFEGPFGLAASAAFFAFSS